MRKRIQLSHKILVTHLICLILISCTQQNNFEETPQLQTLPSEVFNIPSVTFTITIQPAIPKPSLTPIKQVTVTQVNTPTEQVCPTGPVSTGDEIVDDPVAYIGRIFKEGPLGGTFTEGRYIVIEDDSGDYRLSYHRNADFNMMWLSKYICQDENGGRFYQVKDVIVFPEISEERNFSTNLCGIGSEYVPHLIVYGKVERGVTHFVEVLNAWKTNIEDERFEPVTSPENANCVINWDGNFVP